MHLFSPDSGVARLARAWPTYVVLVIMGLVAERIAEATQPVVGLGCLTIGLLGFVAGGGLLYLKEWTKPGPRS